MAVSHSVLVIIYHVLRTKKPYAELGSDNFDKLDTTRIQQHHIRCLEQPSYAVTVTPKRLLDLLGRIFDGMGKGR